MTESIIGGIVSVPSRGNGFLNNFIILIHVDFTMFPSPRGAMGSLMEIDIHQCYARDILVSVPSRGNGFLNEYNQRVVIAEDTVSVPSRGNGFLNIRE